MYGCMYECMYLCMYVYTYTYIYIYHISYIIYIYIYRERERERSRYLHAYTRAARSAERATHSAQRTTRNAQRAARNARDSAEVRARLDCRLNVAYGPSPDEILDIFPAGDNTPVIVYVHGGAWTRWSKDENSYQAPVFVDAGAAFVSVNFALAPQVSLDELVRQNRATVKWVYDHALDFGANPSRLYIAGHSSGAHVVGLLAVTDWD